MSRYIIRRVLGMIPLLLLISLFVFALLNLVPGSPMDEVEQMPNIRPADLERIKENLGLNEPWYFRYFIWLSHALRGDFGISYTNYVDVSTTIKSAMPNTLALSISSILISAVLGVALGIYSALRRNSIFDRVTTVVATAGYSLPSLWLGMLLIILFGVKFQEWGLPSLPVAGVRDLRGGGGFWDRIQHMIMPVAALSIVSIAGWSRYVRSQMLEVIRLDFVRTAQAKGLQQQTVIMRHALRNAILPLVTLVGLSLPELFSGAFIIENVFAYRGMGQVTVESLSRNDYSVAMGCIMMLALLTVIGNLIADVLYGVLDPRVRYD